MTYYQPPAALRQLTDAFDQMPGIGEQSARRMAEWLMYHSDTEAFQQVVNAAAALRICPGCNLAVSEPQTCPLCQREDRDDSRLAIVEHSSSVQPLLDHGYRGRLYVLHGLLSPARGIGPSTLRLPALFAHLQEHPPEQLLLLITDSVEGRATADYLRRSLPQISSQAQSLGEYLASPDQPETRPND